MKEIEAAQEAAELEEAAARRERAGARAQLTRSDQSANGCCEPGVAK